MQSQPCWRKLSISFCGEAMKRSEIYFCCNTILTSFKSSLMPMKVYFVSGKSILCIRCSYITSSTCRFLMAAFAKGFLIFVMVVSSSFKKTTLSPEGNRFLSPYFPHSLFSINRLFFICNRNQACAFRFLCCSSLALLVISILLRG